MNEITIEINKDCEDRENCAEYLRYVAQQIEQGFWAGDGWDTTESDAELNAGAYPLQFGGKNHGEKK